MADTAQHGDKIILTMSYDEGKLLYDWLKWVNITHTNGQPGPIELLLKEIYSK